MEKETFEKEPDSTDLDITEVLNNFSKNTFQA